MTAADPTDTAALSNAETDSRLESLELKIMELEQTVESLDTVVAGLNEKLATVFDACGVLERRLAVMSTETTTSGDSTEVPPHY